MKNIKIGTRLAVGFGLLILFVVMVAMIGISRVSAISDTTSRITDNLYRKVATTNTLANDSLEMSRTARNVLLLNIPEKKAANKNAYDLRRADIAAQMAILEKLVDTPRGKDLLSAVKSAGDEFLPFLDQVVMLGMQNKNSDATELLFGPRYESQAKYLASLKAMVDFQASNMQLGAQSARDVHTTSVVMMSALSLTALIAGCFLALLVTLSVTRPIASAVATAERVARGDLASAVTIDRKDEAGKLLQALSEMQTNLVATVRGVRANAEGVATASAQIAQGNIDLSQRTEEQASSLGETVASMEQLTAAVGQNADNAQLGSQLATKASDIASRGGQAVEKVIATMHTISGGSEQMRTIINAIESIAFQTNILALNAAVEAARAGEQGRGFAVVAGEVRTLAQRSAAASKEIKQLITGSAEHVKHGSSHVNEAGGLMLEIISAVKQVTDLMGEISAASQEQRTGIEQVNVAVAQMDQVTQQNAALVEEASAAAQSMSEQATELRQSMDVFTLPGSEKSVAPTSTVNSRRLGRGHIGAPSPMVAATTPNGRGSWTSI